MTSSMSVEGSLIALTHSLDSDHLPFIYPLPFIYLFFYLFTDLCKERACPQLAKANLGGHALISKLQKKYTDKN